MELHPVKKVLVGVALFVVGFLLGRGIAVIERGVTSSVASEAPALVREVG